MTTSFRSPLLWAHPWVSHQHYAVGNVVTDEAGVAYICTAPLRSTTAPGDDPDHFAAISTGGTGLQGPQGPEGDPGTPGAPGPMLFALLGDTTPLTANTTIPGDNTTHAVSTLVRIGTGNPRITLPPAGYAAGTMMVLVPATDSRIYSIRADTGTPDYIVQDGVTLNLSGDVAMNPPATTILWCDGQRTWYFLPGGQGVQGIQGDPGETGAAGTAGTGFTWQGLWTGTASYSPNDVARYDTSSYINTVATAPSAVADTFTRANQPAFGTASDGNTWAVLGGDGSALSIVSNHGVANGAYSVSRLGSLSAADTDATVQFQRSDSNSLIGLSARYTDGPHKEYYMVLDGSSLALRKNVSGSDSGLLDTSVSVPNDTDYKVRLQVIGTAIKLKLWAAADPEPGSWDLEATDSAIAGAGACVLTLVPRDATLKVAAYEADTAGVDPAADTAHWDLFVQGA